MKRFKKAIGENDIQMVKMCLANQSFNPAAQNNWGIHWACRNGHLEIVNLLLDDPMIVPDVETLSFTCRNGHIDVVKRLLADPRVDPTYDNNRAIIWAGSSGHPEIVRLLFADPRVNPKGEMGICIEYPDGSYCEIVKIGNTIRRIVNGESSVIWDDRLREQYIAWSYRIGGKKYLDAVNDLTGDTI